MSIVVDAIKGEETERVPVTPIITTGHASRIAGIPMHEYVINSKALAEAQSKTRAFYGYDWVFAHQPFQGLSTWEKEHLETDGDDVILTLELGTRIKLPARGSPQTIKTAITEKGDLDSLVVPDAFTKERLEPLTRLLETEEFVCGNLRCPFTMSSTFLYSIEPFLMDLMTDEAFARSVMDFALDYGKAIADAYIEAGAHAMFMEDPSASSSVISPEMYRNFAQPYEKALVDHIGKRIPVIFHICGDITEIVDGMIATGVDCLSIDEAMSMSDIHEKTPVWGNIAPDKLVRGTPEEVYELSKEIVALGEKTVLSSGCVVPGNARPENIKAMVWATKGSKE